MRRARTRRLLRDRPDILAVVEDLRVAHVVGAVNRRLDVEQVLGIADVRLQRRRHRVERLEERREGLSVGLDQGVVGVRDVELGGAVISIDHDLHRVADVVDAGA